MIVKLAEGIWGYFPALRCVVRSQTKASRQTIHIAGSGRILAKIAQLLAGE